MNDYSFYKKYGPLFSFKYRVEDDGTIVVYDNQGVLDMFDDYSLGKQAIDKLAKKNGWYAEPMYGSCDFVFGEL